MKKFLIIIFVLLIQNCRSKIDDMRKNITSEIICSETKRYMVRYVYANELKQAIMNDIKYRENHNYKINFTIIRIPRIESFHIPNSSPEELIKCQITDNHIKKVYPNYIKRFKKIF